MLEDWNFENGDLILIIPKNGSPNQKETLIKSNEKNEKLCFELPDAMIQKCCIDLQNKIRYAFTCAVSIRSFQHGWVIDGKICSQRKKNFFRFMLLFMTVSDTYKKNWGNI